MARTDLTVSTGPSLTALVRTQLDRLIAQGFRPLPRWITADGDIGPAVAVARRALLAYEPGGGEAIRKLRVVGVEPYAWEEMAALRPAQDGEGGGAGPNDPPDFDMALAQDAVVAISTRKGWTERTAETVGALIYHALVEAHRSAVAEASRLLGYPLDAQTGYPEGYEPAAPSGVKKGLSADDYAEALREAGSIRGAARRLGVARQTVMEMMKLHGLSLG